MKKNRKIKHFSTIAIFLAILSYIPGIAVWAQIQFGDLDNDGVLDANDHCPESIVAGSVYVGDCDKGVDNVYIDDGCYLAPVVVDTLRQVVVSPDGSSAKLTTREAQLLGFLAARPEVYESLSNLFPCWFPKREAC